MKIVKLAVGPRSPSSRAGAFAQTVKIGFITSYSGLNGNLGPYMERAVRLYMKQHEKELPPGVKVELITRDDTGPNPDKAKQLAQELIVRDKVQLLAGVVFTPNAMAIAPLATEAKVPFVIMNAGTAVITTRSPYIARISFTLWQSSYPLGAVGGEEVSRPRYIAGERLRPGHRLRGGFSKGFTEGGGKMRRQGAHAAAESRLRRRSCSASRTPSPTRCFVFIPAGKTRDRGDEDFGDLGPRQGRASS